MLHMLCIEGEFFMNIALLTLLFISVNIDFFIILLYLLQKYRFKDVLLGYGLGMIVLWVAGALVSQTLHAFLPMWLFGFLGLIPIYLAIKGEADDDDDDDEIKTSKQKNGTLAVLGIYLGTCGADNFAIYVPVLSTMNWQQLVIGGIYVLILMLISTWLASKFGQLPAVKSFFERFGENTTRIVYAVIGIFVITESNLVPHLWALIH